MTAWILYCAGLCLLAMMCAAGLMLYRDIKREERFAARVRVIHGHPPQQRHTAEPKAIRAALAHATGVVGQAILNSGLVPAKTRTELEESLASSGLRGPQGVGVFIGAKLMLMGLLPLGAWFFTADWSLPSLAHTLIPLIAGLVGLLAPDWVLKRQRQRYQARLEQALPDALDMMVICAQAGLGLGPAVIRVATELQGAYRELALELAQTANELQVLSDSRIALANLGRRTAIDAFRRFSTTLIQTIQYGTPLTDALRTLSAEMRQEMLTNLEAKAARLPVMLTLPMIIFILPCVFLIAGGPAMLQVMHTFNH